MPAHPEPVIRAHNSERHENHNLEGDARDDGVVPAIQQLAVVAVGRGGERAADGLDEQARDVGGQEDDGVPAGPDARDGRVEVEADVLEGQVDAGADHGRGEDDGADLELEGAAIPGVVAEEDAADISCCLYKSVLGLSSITLDCHMFSFFSSPFLSF